MRAVGFWLEAALARAALAGLRALGPEAASNLGGAVLRFLGPWLPASTVAEGNLRRALPELDGPARQRIVRAVWENLGRVIAEFPHLAALRPNLQGPGFEIAGAEIVRALAARGGPMIFFSAHTGNWEMMPPIAAQYGIALSSFYRAPANPRIDALTATLRRRAMGMEVQNFPKGAHGAKAAFAHLARRGYLGILVDQKLNDGIEARFFGLPAMTTAAPATLALRFRAPVIPAHVERLGPARFRLVVEPPLALPETGDRAADIVALTQAINDHIEGWVRARPGEWLWLHRRWPSAEAPPRRPAAAEVTELLQDGRAAHP